MGYDGVMKQICILVALLSLALALFNNGNAAGNQQDPVITDIEEIISQGESASLTTFQRVKDKIEENPKRILPLLLSKANTPGLREADLAIYIWAIGLTRSPKAIDDVIKLSSGKQSEILRGNTYKALASIGGVKAGEYLFNRLKGTSDQRMRYYLLDCLAQIQYGQAIPETVEILEKDPEKYYWQTIFVFGKYGDLAIPFLLEKIGDKDQNTRTNSIMVLGKWLVPAESLEPLKNQFWKEHDPEIRRLILSSIETVNSNLQDVQNFFEEVMHKDQEVNVVRFAEETVSNFDKVKNIIETYKSQKIQDRAAFASEYNKILRSFGKEGDYHVLGAGSIKEDEQRLKRLKEIILQRNSDECFYDYQKVNRIIILNRLI